MRLRKITHFSLLLSNEITRLQRRKILIHKTTILLCAKTKTPKKIVISIDSDVSIQFFTT